MKTVADRIKNDWERLAVGIPATDKIDDPIAKRFLDAAIQNVNFCLLKVQDIREWPDPDKLDAPDISKLPDKLKPAWPSAVMVSGIWVEPTSGTIAGLVNPHESDTSYYFQYMHVLYDEATDTYPVPDFSSPAVTSTKSAGSGNINVSVSEDIAGLTVPARYYVQIVAWNTVGQVFSNIYAFDTGLKPEVTLDQASLVTTSSAIISGTVDPNSLETTYYFKYGTDPNALAKILPGANAGSGTTPIAVNTQLTGLTNDTVYYYKLVASNACGKTDSDTKTFRTLKLYAPVVINYGASELTETQAKLTGSINPMGYDATWLFPWSTSHGLQTYGLVIVDTILSPTLPIDSGNAGAGNVAVPISINIGGLVAGGQYYCQVIGTNANGTAYSDIWGFITPEPEITLTGTLTYSFVAGSGTMDVTVVVKNSGTSGSTLTWTGTITMDAGFSGTIGMDIDTGVLLYNETEDVVVTLTKDGIAAGNYTGTFKVTAPNADDETLPITITVTDDAPSSCPYSLPGNPPPTFTVSGAVPVLINGALDYADNCAWNKVYISNCRADVVLYATRPTGQFQVYDDQYHYHPSGDAMVWLNYSDYFAESDFPCWMQNTGWDASAGNWWSATLAIKKTGQTPAGTYTAEAGHGFVHVDYGAPIFTVT